MSLLHTIAAAVAMVAAPVRAVLPPGIGGDASTPGNGITQASQRRAAAGELPPDATAAIELEAGAVGPVGAEGAGFLSALFGDEAEATTLSNASIAEDKQAAGAIGAGKVLDPVIDLAGKVQTGAVDDLARAAEGLRL